MNTATETRQNLKEIWEKFQAANPRVRIRDAARQLGVSEAELLATATGETVVRLNDDFAAMLHELDALGYVMALTRNEEIVHERKGVYENAKCASLSPPAPLAPGSCPPCPGSTTTSGRLASSGPAMAGRSICGSAAGSGIRTT